MVGTIVYDLGSIADWLTALGTLAAVIVALSLSRQDRKPRADVKAEVKYVSTEGNIKPGHLTLNIVNTGLIPFTLTECTMSFHEEMLGIVGDNYKRLDVGDHHGYSIKYEKIYKLVNSSNRKKVKTYFYFEDVNGKKYKSNKIIIKIDS